MTERLSLSQFTNEEITSMSSHISSQSIPASLSGAALKRFVINAVLLQLIDPVRGEPTTHSLDRHPHDDTWKHEQLQKKFLDSFALVCSTSRKGSETASAVCLEQGHPSGTVLRLARNLGVPDDLMEQLDLILNKLTALSLREITPRSLEPQLLERVIALCSDKIWSLLEELRYPDVYNAIVDAIDRMENDDPCDEDAGSAIFRQWVRHLPLLASINAQPEPAELATHIRWASEARWVHSEYLENFLGLEHELPCWVKNIYKLGRYYVATKAMIKLAVKQPHLFASIRIEAVEAPQQERFSLGNDRRPLLTALKRITTADADDILEQLGQTWLTENPETRLRKACQLTLTVHAEMQLLSFYDHRPEFAPRPLFIGTSKKACYLCHEFMSRHPLAIGVSATHQKIYPTWMLPPCSSTVRKNHKFMLWEFSRHLESTTARDLETRLGLPRRPMNLDSTFGPSLTTTGSLLTGFSALNLSPGVPTASDEVASNVAG